MGKIPDYIPKGSKEQVVEQLKSWVGKRVKRGPTWDWGSQDRHSKGYQVEGKVYSALGWDVSETDGLVAVKWENGKDRGYRVGNEFADVVLVNPSEVYNEVTAQTKAHLNMDEIIDAYKKGLKLRLTEKAFKEYGNGKDREVKIEAINAPDYDKVRKVYFKGNAENGFRCVNQEGVNQEGLHYADKIPMFESVVEAPAEALMEKPKYLGKAYEEADVQPGDEVLADNEQYTVVSFEEARRGEPIFSSGPNVCVYVKTSSNTYLAYKSSSIKKSSQPQQKQEEEKTTMETKMKLMDGFKTLGNKATEGAKTAVGSITSEEVVALFHKHFGDKLPGWWGLIPNVQAVESTVIPGLVYLSTLFIDNKYAKKLQGPVLLAWQGRVHDDVKALWKSLFPFLKELSSMVHDVATEAKEE